MQPATPDLPSPDRDTARLWAILTLAAALAFVGFSWAAPAFRGYTAAQLPLFDAAPPIQPAGWAFAIWGVIYAWLVASAGFGLLKRAESPDWAGHRAPLTASMALGAGWLWVAVADAVLATVMIWAMLALALRALARAPRRDPWLGRVPIGLYAGWLTAASCVSLGVTLAGFGLLPSGRVAALALIPVAALIAAAVVWRQAPAGGYAAAAIWALGGIVAANWGRDPLVAGLAGALALGLAALWALAQGRLAGAPPRG
jgi:hypothetical protein